MKSEERLTKLRNESCGVTLPADSFFQIHHSHEKIRRAIQLRPAKLETIVAGYQYQAARSESE